MSPDCPYNRCRWWVADRWTTATSVFLPQCGWVAILAFTLLGSLRAEPLALSVQGRDRASGRAQPATMAMEPSQAAMVVIDMWDRHWCRTYTARVGNMVPRMNRTLNAARKLGIQVVFAPSDIVEFYRDHPARKAMLAIPAHDEPVRVAFNPPPQPAGMDNCECGPDRPCRNHRVWTQQHPDLEIREGDLITNCNNARELFNLCQERHVDTLIYLGVASNMCVQNRAAGMLNARRHGFGLLFVRDLVEAITANGVDPVTREPDWNFTPAKGSARIAKYLEQEVAPSIASRQLLDLAGLRTTGHDRRSHIVFVIADDEYRTERTLPEFAHAHLEPTYHCSYVFARGNAPENRHDVPGLDALYDADVLVLSMRRRALPVIQMDHLERYVRSGKPIVALRVSAVPFQAEPPDRAPGHVIWRDFDQEVLGCHYRGYHGEARDTGTEVWAEPAAKEHPILRGLTNTRFHSAMWLYRVNPLTPTATVLLRGRWSEREPDEPVAWTNTYEGARVFYAALGHWEDFKIATFNQLLRNGILWALGEERAIPPLGPLK